MIFAVVGTGTGVGKTTVSVALVHLLRERFRVGAWKPIETGGDADGRALGEAAGSDAGPTIALPLALAPSVAARSAARRIDLVGLAEEAHARAAWVQHLVVELPGGLYSPLNDEGVTNAELVRAMEVDRVILVAANRLGVLHDVEVCRRAMGLDAIREDVVVLTGGDPTDPSVSSNGDELRARGPVVEVPAVGADAQLRAWLESTTAD